MLELFKFKNKNADLKTPKYLLDEGEPDYYTIAEQNLEYYRENGNLRTENEELKDKVNELDDLNFKTTQENATLFERVQELEGLHEQTEEEIMTLDEIRNIESDLYMGTLMSNALDKTTEERNTYKETINIMCDKFGIEHNEVFNIIDTIKGKDSKNEREK